MDLIERVAEWEIRHYKGTLATLFIVASRHRLYLWLG